MAKIGIIHGPNLNLLGERETSVYGDLKLGDIDRLIAERLGDAHQVMSFQSNSEGGIIDTLHSWRNQVEGIVINAGAYTHTSYAIRDAIAALNIPVVEVHLSNIYARQEFRRHSVLAPVCIGQISGFGWLSYVLGAHALLHRLKK